MDRWVGLPRHYQRSSRLCNPATGKPPLPLQAQGKFCCSTRAEMALEGALNELASNPPESPENLNIMCDSQAALQSIQDEVDTKCRKVRECWRHINDLTSLGRNIHLQWILGHAGIHYNEEADKPARRGASENQGQRPIDLSSAQRAAVVRANSLTEARIRDSYRHPEPTPEMEQLPRRVQIVISQLRVGSCTLTRDSLFRFGQTADASFPGCGEPDSAEHLLTECAAYQGPRRRRWGPTQHTILADSATKI